MTLPPKLSEKGSERAVEFIPIDQGVPYRFPPNVQDYLP
jgi:hypothetical protein|tara:strand:+ start:4341 stop:4457 length:117 start_codon:yes stop_codon:yes gene_type:complete